MGFAAMAGRRNKHRLFASISSSSSVTNNIRLHYLSSTIKQNWAAVRGWTFNECRHSSKPCSLAISADKKSYSRDEMVEINVKGINLKAVNALSFALPYNPQDFEFVGIVPVNMKTLENMTADRLHTSGQRALYPTFVNVGDEETLEGTTDLFVIRLKAKRKVNFDLKPLDGLLVDQHLNTVKFWSG